MKKITFFGSGTEDFQGEKPEIDSVVSTISQEYDELLFGGTNIGLMGKFATSAKENNMKVTSVVPEWFAEKHSDLMFPGDKKILAHDLAERKKYLEDTNAILCYPGGIGSLDEIFNILA